MSNLMDSNAPPLVVLSSRLKADMTQQDRGPSLRASGPSAINELQAWPCQTNGDLVFVKCRKTCDMDSGFDEVPFIFAGANFIYTLHK